MMAYLGISFCAMIIAFSISVLALAIENDGKGFLVRSIIFGIVAGIVTFTALCLLGL